MLCRLNHELLPDPGNPIASTTVPLLARTGVGDGAATTGSGAEAATADGSAATAGAGVAATGLGRDPPRPPRLRRRRGVRGLGSTAADSATGAEAGAGVGAPCGSGLDGRRDWSTGASARDLGPPPGSFL